MTSAAVTNTQIAMDKQVSGKMSQNSPGLLSVVESPAQKQVEFSFVKELASHITRQVERHIPVFVMPPMYCHDQRSDSEKFSDQLCAALTDCLHRGVRRLLLVPWGDGQMTDALIEATTRALYAATGKEVSTLTISAPCVHVDGVSVKRAFEGFSSVQDQLNPLVEQFPGWDHEYTCFSAADAKIVLLRSINCMRLQPRGNTMKLTIMKALAAAFCPDQVMTMPVSTLNQWERDGLIYAHYLVSLLSAALEPLRHER